MADSSEDHEDLRKLLELHWKHCQHLENERAQFMSVYAVIMGGVLAFVFQKGIDSPVPFGFLIIFTLFSFFHSVRWNYAFEHHRERVNFLIREIIRDRTISVDHALLTMDIPSVGKPPADSGIVSRFRKCFRTRFLFPLFYLAIFMVLLPATLAITFHEQMPAVGVVSIVLIGITSFLGKRVLSSLANVKKQYPSLTGQMEK